MELLVFSPSDIGIWPRIFIFLSTIIIGVGISVGLSLINFTIKCFPFFRELNKTKAFSNNINFAIRNKLIYLVFNCHLFSCIFSFKDALDNNDTDDELTTHINHYLFIKCGPIIRKSLLLYLIASILMFILAIYLLVCISIIFMSNGLAIHTIAYGISCWIAVILLVLVCLSYTILYCFNYHASNYIKNLTKKVRINPLNIFARFNNLSMRAINSYGSFDWCDIFSKLLNVDHVTIKKLRQFICFSITDTKLFDNYKLSNNLKYQLHLVLDQLSDPKVLDALMNYWSNPRLSYSLMNYDPVLADFLMGDTKANMRHVIECLADSADTYIKSNINLKVISDNSKHDSLPNQLHTFNDKMSTLPNN